MKSVAFAFVALAAFSAHSVAETAQEIRRNGCGSESRTAKLIMQHRQRGGIMSDMLSKVSKINNGSPDPSADAVIIAAFDVPQYASQANQDRAIREFENESFRDCLKRP